MNHGHLTKSLLVALSITSLMACPLWAHAKGKDGAKADAFMNVPVYTAPSHTEDGQYKIDDESGRLFVSPKALEPYGIHAVKHKGATYALRLPEPIEGTALWHDTSVSLTVPHKTIGKEDKIDITSIRRPLGISYSIDGAQKFVIPPTSPSLAAPKLKDIRQGEDVAQKGGLGMALFWDPIMDTEQEMHPVKTGHPVLSPCAFRITQEGVVLRHPHFDVLIEKARENGYDVWPLVDNDFNPEKTHAILSNANTREKIIKELIGYAALYEFKGYNIDFENVNYKDRHLLTSFVADFSKAAHAYGLKTSMDITPLSDSPNWSLVYEREELGKHLDYVMLMAYDQVGRTSPVPGPTATLPWVEKSIQTLLPLVPADKIVLGIPLYMRVWYESSDGKDLPKTIKDWPHSVAKGNGSTKKRKGKLFVRTLTLKDSAAVFEKYKSHIVWDDALKLYYLEAPLPQGTLKVWFEDTKSLQEKMRLRTTYSLYGVSFWRKGFEPDTFWSNFAKHELT